MVQFMRRSPRFRALMQDLFAGTQPYLELRGRLLRNLSGTLREVLMNLVAESRGPGELARRVMKTSRSEALFARAQALIPGGVNSPVRAFRSVGGRAAIHRAR